MTASLEYIGRTTERSRHLYLMDAPAPEDVPSVLEPAGSRFVCLLAWDAEGAAPEAVEDLARRVVAAGCAYICCWGAGCRAVHDAFDFVTTQRDPDAPLIMSTWHDDETIADALWFALFCAHPDDSAGECCRVVCISIGSSSHAEELRSAMGDIQRSSAKPLGHN
ncbi:MAG TPA: hypothetical protein VIV60_09990 [Polyangiaceae bacterium]